MIRKIKQWWTNRKKKLDIPSYMKDTYTMQQMESAYRLGYNDGKRDGLNIAREQATKSLKEILWQQNKKK